MLSQWDSFLKNLGEWQGSFTRLSPQGELIEDTPTVVTLEGRENNQAVHQVVRYLPPDKPSRDVVVDYSKTSLNRSILFFEDGAFAQGSMQFAPYSNFGGEFGLIKSDRRLRMVILYNGSSQLERVVLIREKLPSSNTPERSALTVNSLLGEWQGNGVTIYPDFRTPDIFNSHLKITQPSNNYLDQSLSFGTRTITSQARIDGSRLLFEDSPLKIQILLLPDGASCNCPLEAKLGHKFVLEIGWLLAPNKRKRIMRNYDEKGTWTSCTLVTETKLN
ncbi:MAG: DUF3598 family protein [Xenococcaceae cyanobacterium MO_167.B27]|nr:DUF3598 family protein [Xenococcaceae cyanobacterium MO_167.B27]